MSDLIGAIFEIIVDAVEWISMDVIWDSLWRRKKVSPDGDASP